MTNQPYALANNDDFDPYDFDIWPTDVGLSSVHAHPTYRINAGTLIRLDGTIIPTTEPVKNIYSLYKI